MLLATDLPRHTPANEDRRLEGAGPEHTGAGRNGKWPLKAAADGDPYELRLRELRLAKPWMDMLTRGTRLVVDFEEWVNKSSGQGKIAIGIDHEDGKDPEQLVAWNFFIGLRMYADVVPLMFAWADCSLHSETYEQADLENYEDECTFWDEGDMFYRESFEDWSAANRGERIRPYANGAGEVDFFRVELTLNELGKAFLIVDNFANTKVRQFTSS